jgi:hypothetical protein
MKNDLKQEDADHLIAVEKQACDHKEYLYPEVGERLKIPIKSSDKRTSFIINISRHGASLTKNTSQLRVYKTIILVRVDIGGSPHTNPNGVAVPCPHIHIYKEGFMDKWAYLLPKTFKDPTDKLRVVDNFMDYCNVVNKPIIVRGLFS